MRANHWIRERSIGVMLAALLVGSISGIAIVILSRGAQFAHEMFFGLKSGEYLSIAVFSQNWRPLLVLPIGGLSVGLIAYGSRKFVHGRLSDTIEANALQGGRMSMIGSLYITLHTFLSNAAGASVGLEAAYTQFCGAVASKLGRLYDARRAEQRLLVSCGAAAAIAAAFHAPMTGAFYGFEVVLGSYSTGALAPVALSATIAALFASYLQPLHGAYETNALIHLDLAMMSNLAVLSTVSALAGIGVMMMVAQSEKLFNRMPVPSWVKPAIGGALVGVMTLYSPAILSAGHGTFSKMFASDSPLIFLFIILCLKSIASAVSLGSGFRGGLFFASLLIGELIGRVYGGSVVSLFPDARIDIAQMALLGMATFGTAIIGAPMAMAALALELTDNVPLFAAALVACAITSIIVRESFGFSFATWRFHLRGEAIRGPKDIGWVQDMKVTDMMRHDVKILPHTLTLDKARLSNPLNSSREIFLVDERHAYCGLVLMSDLYASGEQDARSLSDIAILSDHALEPSMTIRQALDLFSKTHADVLAVIDPSENGKILGALSESHALRAYGAELDRRNFEDS